MSMLHPSEDQTRVQDEYRKNIGKRLRLRAAAKQRVHKTAQAVLRHRRKEMEARCGDKLFLDPSKKKYVIRDSHCKFDCGKIKTIYTKALINDNMDVAKTVAELYNKKCQ